LSSAIQRVTATYILVRPKASLVHGGAAVSGSRDQPNVAEHL